MTSARRMTKGSLCAMGGLTPMPVQSAIRHWPEDFDTSLADRRAPASVSASSTEEGPNT